MNGLHLIQYLKEASYPVTGTPLVAFLGDSVTHASCAGLTTGSR